MARYKAKVKTPTGVKTIEIQARNDSDARRALESQGRILAFSKTHTLGLDLGLSPVDRQTFYSRMSAMLQSRVGTSEALRLMRDTFTGRIQEVSNRLLLQVESGADFGTALERVGAPDFPPATIALIKAGSKSGETWRAIKDAAIFEAELGNVKKGASKGIWVGVGSLLMAGIVTVLANEVFGPKIMASPMIASAVKKGAVDIGWIVTASNIATYSIAALLSVILVGVLVSVLLRAIIPVKADAVIMRVPFYKDLVLSRNNFVVLYGLSLLIRSGVRTEEALRLGAEGAPKGALRADLTNACAAVKSGRPWPKVMQTLHPTDKAALLSATDREQIATTLYAQAMQYKELYAQRLGTFVPALNLLAALFMSIAGAILFGQVILPMLMASAAAF